MMTSTHCAVCGHETDDKHYVTFRYIGGYYIKVYVCDAVPDNKVMMMMLRSVEDIIREQP